MKINLLPDFAADWRDMTLVHYRFAPQDLAAAAAFPLDLYDGSAYVSLVLFRLMRMRPWGWGRAGQWLCRPISDHFFLNLRTYVRTAQGPGIEFLAEWIPNLVSLRLGPMLYGLPYRLGRFSTKRRAGALGTTRATITDSALPGRIEIATGAGSGPEMPCERGSLAEFLLERYLAFTSHRGVRRFFRVEHPAWRVREPSWFSCAASLVEQAFPWFACGELAGAHETVGFRSVRMTRAVPLRPVPDGQRPADPPLAVHHRRARRSRNAFFAVLD